jgi:hypothetical protein
MALTKHYLDDIDIRLLMYLRECIKQRSPRYFKAKHIAKDLGFLTPKIVGTRLAYMSEINLDDIKISNHSYAISTTWKVDKVVI